MIPEHAVREYAVAKFGDEDQADKFLKRARSEVLGRGCLGGISSDGDTYETSCQGSTPGTQYSVRVTLPEGSRPPAVMSSGPTSSSCDCPYAQSGTPRPCKHILALLLSLAATEKAEASAPRETPLHPGRSSSIPIVSPAGGGQQTAAGPAAAVAGRTAATAGKRRLPPSWSRPQNGEADATAEPPGAPLADPQSAAASARQPTPKAAEASEVKGASRPAKKPNNAAPPRPWTASKQRATGLGKRKDMPEALPPNSVKSITREQFLAVTDEQLVEACKALVAAEETKRVPAQIATEAKASSRRQQPAKGPAIKASSKRDTSSPEKCKRHSHQTEQQPVKTEQPTPATAETAPQRLNTKARRPRTLAELISGLGNDDDDDDAEFSIPTPTTGCTVQSSSATVRQPEAPQGPDQQQFSAHGVSAGSGGQSRAVEEGTELPAGPPGAIGNGPKKKASFRERLKGLL